MKSKKLKVKFTWVPRHKNLAGELLEAHMKKE